jgi:HD-GYP domain-containing protein (c-di-GMP phosphodiesterase class II)
MSQDEALEELKRCSGSQFDPRVVENLTKVLKERKEEVLSVPDNRR